jgi:hypothetical protein
MTNERSRKQFVNLVLLIYWLTILEGIVRKWILPDLSNVLFFMKDPVVVLTYCLVLKNGMRPIRSSFLSIGVLFAMAALSLAVVQFALRLPGMTLLLAGYGFRNYFLFFPLAFLIPKYFTQSDVDRVIRHTLLMTGPVAILVFFQFSSPSTAIINLGAARDVSSFGFGTTVSFVRPYGPFSSPAGLSAFVVTSVAMLLTVLFKPILQRSIGRTLLSISSTSILVCVVLSGSRGTIVACGIVIGLTTAALIATPRFQIVLRSAGILFVLLPVGFGAASVVFPQAVQAFAERWIGANETESSTIRFGVWGRALFGPFYFLEMVPDVPMVGFGLGSGGNLTGGVT